MKRFGGIEFVRRTNFNSFSPVNETLLIQLRNLLIRSNMSTGSFDPTKIASLFQIHPPQASVTIFHTSSYSYFILPFISGLVQ